MVITKILGDVQQRVCTLCDHNDIEDEFHFILKCPFYSDIRKMYIKKYYYQKPSTFKLVNLLSECESVMKPF